MYFSKRLFRFISQAKILRINLHKMNLTSAVDGLSSVRPVVGVVQMTSTSDKEATFLELAGLVERAKNMGAKVVFVPECADYVASNKDQSISLAEPLDGPIVNKYKELASRLGVWLNIGSFHENASDGTEATANKIYNTQLMIDDGGKIQSIYRKIHLFDVDVPGGRQMRESSTTLPGKQIVAPIATPVGKVGMAICYDMRFPEMALTLSRMGAEILIYPSAFFIPTGMAHWDVLLRSRAIESQCYVIAAAQVGAHHEKRSSYGNAMIVDPWGVVIGRCHDQPDVCVASIDIPLLQKRRRDLPVSLHRRPDLYDLITPSYMLNPSRTSNGITTDPNQSKVDLTNVYQFGPHPVKGTSVFYTSTLSVAFVNRKPVLPGHVLVMSRRVVPKLADLTPGEVADLFVTVQKVSSVIERHYGAGSSTVAVQDGADAGQTVSHVHVHVLRRKVGDFERNDDVYDKLEKHDKQPEIKWRTDEEMGVEAEQLRKYFV